MKKKRIDIANTKLKILEIVAKDPGLTNYQVKTLLWKEHSVYTDPRTVQKYMNEIAIILNRIKLDVEQQIRAKAEQSGSLWSRITQSLK